MNRRLLGTQRVPSAMEIEHSRQNSSSNLPQPKEPNSRFSELQLRRDRRRTSENKVVDIRNPQPEQKLCDFCSQLILLSIYDQHIIDCPQKPGNQQKKTDTLMTEDVDGRQGQQEQSQSNTMEIEENQLQLARPLPDFSIHPSEQAPDNLFNLFGRFRNPLRTFPRPEPQQQQSQPQQPQAPTTTSSFLSSIFNSIFNPLRHLHRDNLPIEPEHNPTTAPVEGQNPPDSEGGLFSRGAIFVRTIQPGPNGTLIVRMRVIPLGNLFGNQEENGEEGNQLPNDGLIGGLISMLLGMHGHGLFEEERGLEKEALESLPVVSYHNEQFKHVNEEYKSCPICLDQFEEEQEVRFLWCLHRFHKNCVDQWLDKHTTCPICKKDYSEAVKNCEEVCEETCKESS